MRVWKSGSNIWWHINGTWCICYIRKVSYKNIDKEKYIVSGIYIDKYGCWYKVDFNKEYEFNIPESIIKLENITTYLKDFDVAFPVLHGLYGEDGKIQGMFEMLNIPYVGCNVLSSAIAMDKVYQKII